MISLIVRLIDRWRWAKAESQRDYVSQSWLKQQSYDKSGY